jgi:hypothetical protein
VSTLRYNGVDLSFLSTFSVTFDPVYDDLSRRDYLWTKVTISCSFIVSPGYPPAQNGEDMDATWVRINHLLNSPRKPLTYAAGNNKIIDVSGTDANNGPLATCGISKVVGTQSLVCHFRVETYQVDCDKPGAPGPPYVSNRWTETIDIDAQAMSRRTRTGKIVARADLQPNADKLREIIVPPLEPDCIRLESSYSLSPDGQTLSYRHVDQEQYVMPPEPAAQAEGRMTISCNNVNKFYGECSLRLRGSKTTDKAILMHRAISLALAKLILAGLIPKPPVNEPGKPAARAAYPITVSYSEDMYANDVAVRVRGIVSATDGRLTTDFRPVGDVNPGGVGPRPFAPGNRNNNVAPPLPVIGAGASPGSLAWLLVPKEHTAPGGAIVFDPGSRGTAQFLIAAALNQDPCLRMLQTQSMDQSPNADLFGPNLKNVPATVTTTPMAADDNRSIHTPSETGVYTEYHVSQQTYLDPQVLVIPVGASGRGPSVCRYGEAVSYKVVQWLATRYGGQPVVPDPKPLDTNLVLMNAQVEVLELGAAADGESPRYAVTGQYTYVYRDPKQAVINAAVPPWMKPEYVKNNSVSLFPLGFSQGIANYNNIAGPIMASVDGNVTTKDGGVGALNYPGAVGGAGGGGGDF